MRVIFAMIAIFKKEIRHEPGGKFTEEKSFHIRHFKSEYAFNITPQKKSGVALSQLEYLLPHTETQTRTDQSRSLLHR